MKTERQFAGLRWFNGLMGLLHLAQGILMVVLSNQLTLPVTSSFLHYFPNTAKLSPVTETIFNLRIGYALAAFLFISAFAHFLVVTPGIYQWYLRNLKNNINYIRWVEYSVSASLMVVIIGMLSGIYDIAAIIGLFSLIAVMNLLGLIMEQQKWGAAKLNWTPFVIGCLAGIIPWLAVGIYFFGSASTGKMPVFVYFIMVSIFTLYFSFALNMLLQYKRWGPWKDYSFGEKMYIVLSLVAKSALAWQIFYGTLNRSLY
jgi:hypothetical protein